MPLTFDQPPLNEVLVGYTFLPRPDLLIPHIGRFWTEISDQYPGCQHAPVVLDTPEEPAAIDLSLPRVWYLNDESGFLVQVQQDRLMLSWRDLGKGARYPRFPSVKAEFLRIDGLFRAHVERLTGVAIQPAEFLTNYVNLIRSGEGWSGFRDLARVFPCLQWTQPATTRLSEPRVASWALDFALPESLGSLITTLNQGKVRADGTPVLRFELAAKSGPEGPRRMDMSAWFDGAHDAIVHAFKELTGPEMHSQYWNLKQGDEQ